MSLTDIAEFYNKNLYYNAYLIFCGTLGLYCWFCYRDEETSEFLFKISWPENKAIRRVIQFFLGYIGYMSMLLAAMIFFKIIFSPFSLAELLTDYGKMISKNPYYRIALTIFLGFAGYLLYLIKKHIPILFGVMLLITGIITIYLGLATPDQSSTTAAITQALALIGGIALITEAIGYLKKHESS